LPIRFAFPFAAEAVLFDLDGTLVDTAPDLTIALNAMLAELGRPLVSLEQVTSWIGNGAPRLVKRALTGLMEAEPDAHLFEQALASFRKHHARHLCVNSRVYPGAQEALISLTRSGFKLACVTNKPAMFTEPFLHQIGLAGCFGVIVSGDTRPAKKPDAEPLRYACERLGVPPTRTVMVGDSANDVRAARAAGMPAVVVPYGYNHGKDVSELDADVVVDSLAELPQYLVYRKVQ
jgi:phosphoglycolate phosphatase